MKPRKGSVRLGWFLGKEANFTLITLGDFQTSRKAHVLLQSLGGSPKRFPFSVQA